MEGENLSHTVLGLIFNVSVKVSRCVSGELVHVTGSRLGQHMPVGMAYGRGSYGK